MSQENSDIKDWISEIDDARAELARLSHDLAGGRPETFQGNIERIDRLLIRLDQIQQFLRRFNNSINN